MYHIKIPKMELELQLLSHPSYPSLHAITSVLDHFNLDNTALEVPQNRETFDLLPKEFMSFINTKNGSEFVVAKKINNGVQIYFGNRTKETLSFEEFIAVWTGVVVGIESKAFEPPVSQVENKTFTPILYITSLLLLLAGFLLVKPTWFESVHFTLSLIGVIISVFIVKHELGFYSKALEKICTATNTASCDAVLHSKGASISPNLKLSDLSLIYFTGLLLAWLVLSNLSQSTHIIVFISLFALPITFYSIYYQNFVVKKWCPLCLGLIAVLWLQAGSLMLNSFNFSNIQLPYTSVYLLFLSFVFVASLWLTIKPLIITLNKYKDLKIAYHKFKRNFTLFDAVYQKSPLLNTNSLIKNEIILGNKNAAIEIILITNPSCYYCKEAHSDIENILNKKNNVKISIRFSVAQDATNIAYNVALKLLEIYNHDSIKTCKCALKEAYDKDANLEKWLVKWGKADNTEFAETLKKQKEWCSEQNINFTPALILNGKLFPKEYERSDLIYFLDDLSEPSLNSLKEEIILN